MFPSFLGGGGGSLACYEEHCLLGSEMTSLFLQGSFWWLQLSGPFFFVILKNFSFPAFLPILDNDVLPTLWSNC